jgi:hypothetical protein
LPIDHSRKRQSQLAPRVLRDFFREIDLHGNTLVERHRRGPRVPLFKPPLWIAARAVNREHAPLSRAPTVDFNTVDDFRRAASFVSPHASMVPPCTAKRHQTRTKRRHQPRTIARATAPQNAAAQRNDAPKT